MVRSCRPIGRRTPAGTRRRGNVAGWHTQRSAEGTAAKEVVAEQGEQRVVAAGVVEQVEQTAAMAAAVDQAE